MAGTSTSTQTPSTSSRSAESAGWLGIVLTLVAIIVAIVILRLPELSGWQQQYDPTGHWWLSTIIASLPVIVLLGALAFGHVKAHLSLIHI